MPSPTTLIPGLQGLIPAIPALPDAASITQKAEAAVPALSYLPDDFLANLMATGVNITIALTIMVVGWLAAQWLSHRAVSSLGRIGETAASFIASTMRFVVITVAFVVAIIQLGVPAQTLVTIMGAMVVALGLGLKDTLTNVAAGIMLLVNRPFDVGDYVEIDNLAGTVKRINLFQTELNTYKNIRIFMPNQKVWDNAVQNFSHNRQRMVEVTVGLDYSHKPSVCREAIAAAITKHPAVLADPAPFIGLVELADSAVNFTVRVWVKTPDWSQVRYGLLDYIKDECEARGLSIPFPQRVVRMVKEGGSDKAAPKGKPAKTTAKAKRLAKPSTQRSNVQTEG
ncbi:MAG: mechanosensitive ion channel family protein [Pseudomonadaceae bacterium]|nr:mechanosensitive ion channel family protein [Pseudomonadaceae bacterium]